MAYLRGSLKTRSLTHHGSSQIRHRLMSVYIYGKMSTKINHDHENVF